MLQAIDSLAPNESDARLAALGIRVIRGEARFVDGDTVAVGDIQLKARRFVLATGSVPSVPPLPGLDTTPYLTSETIFGLEELPLHLIVLGAGATGLELAQAFCRLGSEVSVLSTGRPPASEDSECAGILIDALTQQGIHFHTDV